MGNKPLLTIAIPTYNRSSLLLRCLQSLIPQMKPEYNVEIIIYDNASIDDTSKILGNFTHLNYFKYVRNDSNIGPDLNIAKSYYQASGQYVHVFGDDDVFLPGYLDHIIPLLTNYKYGAIFLNYYEFLNDWKAEAPKDTRKHWNYSYDKYIFEVIRSRIGFISAFIINTSYVDKHRLISEAGTNLNHVSLYTRSICGIDNNLYISKCLLAQQSGNSGGFNYFKVFGENQFNVLKDASNGDFFIIKMVFDELFICLFPTLIIKIRINRIKNIQNNFSQFLEPWSASLKSYNIFLKPIIKLPILLALVYIIPIKIISFISKFKIREPKHYKNKF